MGGVYHAFERPIFVFSILYFSWHHKTLSWEEYIMHSRGLSSFLHIQEEFLYFQFSVVPGTTKLFHGRSILCIQEANFCIFSSLFFLAPQNSFMGVYHAFERPIFTWEGENMYLMLGVFSPSMGHNRDGQTPILVSYLIHRWNLQFLNTNYIFVLVLFASLTVRNL